MITTSYHKAMDDIVEKLSGLGPAPSADSSPAPGPTARCCPTRRFLGRRAASLGLAEWIVCHARPDAMLAFAAISRRVSPGRFSKYLWDRLIA